MDRMKITDRIKETVGKKCCNCGSDVDLIYHHIVPLAFGGNDCISNLACLCGKCHDMIHFGKSNNIDHGAAVRAGIKARKENGGTFGRKRKDGQKGIQIMRIIVENSTQFNFESEFTEAEVMKMAGVRNVCYYKYKKELLQALQETVWPYPFARPSIIRDAPLRPSTIKKLAERR